MNELIQELVKIPIGYRLATLGAAGILVGYLANLLAFALSMRPDRNPWSRFHPYDARNRWLDRLPIVGWPRLRRKSGALGAGFWMWPIAAELLMAAFCAVLYWWEVPMGEVISGGQVAESGKFPASPITLEIMHALYGAHVLLAFFMLAASLIDLDERIIPDEITVPGTLIGLLLAAGYAWTLMPVDVHLQPPGIQFVEFMTLVYPARSYPDQWPAWLKAPEQTLPLLVGLGIFWFWCLALLPWLWLPKRGFEKAVRMFVGHATRAESFPSILMIAICGGAGIIMTWWLGGPGWAALLSALAGLAMGGGLVWAVRIIFTAILNKEAMGFGDVTLLAMIGTYLGWQAPIFIFFVAPCIGLVLALTQVVLGLGREIPFGPFLCLATVIVIAAWRLFWQRFFDLFDPVRNNAQFPEFVRILLEPIPGLSLPPILSLLTVCAALGALVAGICHLARSRRAPA